MARKFSIKRHVAICQAAIRRNHRWLVQYLPDGIDPDRQMARMYKGDINDIQRIIGFLRAKKFKLAYNACWRMDTAARDEIWQTVNVLENVVNPD